MTAPYLIPCLVELRDEFDRIAPNRDDGADGWIGDAEHATRTSDHNPDAAGRVLALDIDSTGPWPEPFDRYVQTIVARQRAGWDGRLEYVIWDRRISSRSSHWEWQTYTGSTDPHTGHAHFSGRHDHTGDRDTTPWEVDGMTPAEMISALTTELAKPKSTLAGQLRAIGWQYDGRGIPEDLTTLGCLNELVGTVRRLETKVDALAEPILPPPAE